MFRGTIEFRPFFTPGFGHTHDGSAAQRTCAQSRYSKVIILDRALSPFGSLAPPSLGPSFRQPLNHLLRQLWADSTLFVFKVNIRLFPLALLRLGKFRPAVDIGLLIIFAP